MINTPERNNLRNVAVPINEANSINALGQTNQTQAIIRNKSNESTTALVNNNQISSSIQLANPKMIHYQQTITQIPQVINKKIQENYSHIHVENVIQKNLNMLKQIQSEQQLQTSMQSSPKLLFQERIENINPRNDETVKKIRQFSLASDYFSSNSKGNEIVLQATVQQKIDNSQTLKISNPVDKNQQGCDRQSQENSLKQVQNKQQSIINDQQISDTINEKIFNALEIVGQNKEIANKVMLLTKEIERLRLIMNENEDENKQLQEKIEQLEQGNRESQVNIKNLQVSAAQKQQTLEISEERRQELHRTVENQQKQIIELSKDKEKAINISIEYEFKIKQLLSENEKVLKINDSLFNEKQKLQEEIANQTINNNLNRAQIDDLNNELRQKSDAIRLLESDKIQWNQQLKQNEIMQLQQNIEQEKLELEVIEIQNQNEQLQQVNKELQETLESLSNKYQQLINSNEIVQNELNITRETFLQIKSELTNQVSNLQEENREYRLKSESLNLQNTQLNKQSVEQQAHIKQLSKKLLDQDEMINKGQHQIASLNAEVQKERDSSKLEVQKLQSVQNQTMELAEVNQQLQLKLKEFQGQYQEQILKIQQLEFTIQQKNSQISNQADQFKENQVAYNNILKKNQEILKFNEDLQKNDTSQKLIEEISLEKNELIGKVNLLLTENENLMKANEKLEKQLKNKIEEIDIKKKLLLQFQKENENFRSQINNLPQSERVESLLGTQRSQNQILMQRLQEREKEIQIINQEMEQLRIKLIQYQQKEQLLHSEDASQIQANHYKSKISTLSSSNEKLQNENQQLYDLLKLRKQEIQILTEKLEKKNQSVNNNNINNSSNNQNTA